VTLKSICFLLDTYYQLPGVRTESEQQSIFNMAAAKAPHTSIDILALKERYEALFMKLCVDGYFTKSDAENAQKMRWPYDILPEGELTIIFTVDKEDYLVSTRITDHTSACAVEIDIVLEATGFRFTKFVLVSGWAE